MVNKEYYLTVLKRLREAIKRKRSDLWRGKNGCSIKTTLAHSSLLIHDFLIKHGHLLVPQALYLPDLAPAHFFLFAKLKSILKG